jgi:methyl-accepting chemotaxis protein
MGQERPISRGAGKRARRARKRALRTHRARKREGRRLPMGFQVWLGVGALLALLAGSVLVAVFLIVGVRHHESHLNDRAVPYARAVAAAALNAKGVANDERGFLMTGDQKFIDEANNRARSARAWFAASAAAASSDAQRSTVTEARTGFQQWITAVRREFAAFQTGQRRGPISASLGPDRALRKRYEATLARAQALGESAVRSADVSVADASSRSIAILLTWLLVALVIGVGIAYWLVRSIAVPLARLVAMLGRTQELRMPL